MDIGGWNKKSFMEPVKKTFYNATTPDGKRVIVEMGRERIDQPIRCEVHYGELKPYVANLEIQVKDIVSQVKSAFKKFERANWKPDIDLFLRSFQIIVKDDKERIAERIGRDLKGMLAREEIFCADTQNTFWWIPDELTLEPLRYVWDTRPNGEERLFFKSFIEEQSKKDGVLMVKATFEFAIEADWHLTE